LLPDPLGLHREIHHEVRGLLRDLGRVPAAIHRAHLRHLDAFFGGRTYYAPHRHHHDSYAFPVWVGETVVYQPYSYCEGQLFAPPRVRPTLWYEWGSPHAGHWCAHHRGYYPTRHSCFRGAVQPRAYDRGWYGDRDGGHRRYEVRGRDRGQRRYEGRDWGRGQRRDEGRDWDRGRRYDRGDRGRERSYDRRDRDRERRYERRDRDRHDRRSGHGRSQRPDRGRGHR
jgi:hypothetical protein